MGSQEHWDAIYGAKGPEDLSWSRPHLDRSLAFLDAAQLEHGSAVIDIGGGASTFVDDLVERGYSNVTVLDLSITALETAKRRLADRAAQVRWICADVTEGPLPAETYDFWHDRAVFHFLRDPLARSQYVEAVRRSLKAGGHVVVATFGPHGPEKCSGLEVLRFSSEELHAEFGPDFAKISAATEMHTTPWGAEQEFVYCYCRLPRLKD